VTESTQKPFMPVSADDDDMALNYVLSRIRMQDATMLTHQSKERGRDSTRLRPDDVHRLSVESSMHRRA